jgi:uncharacterized repeat protein (TIGR03837 family)
LNGHPQRWDIFCVVIDNFGDIGVCWRLARQLAAEHGLEVRLWVDNLEQLKPLNPEIDPAREIQFSKNVEIRSWRADFADREVADVVIEAFGCPLPERYEAAMANRETPPVWINLEYLSAEAWVESCHALPSPHPRLKLTKYFFFPGFTPETGGLLRENGLLDARDAFQASPQAFRQSLALPPADPQEILVSLFCYDTAPIGELLTAWEASTLPVRCLLPAGKAMPQVATHFDVDSLYPGSVLQRGNLTLHVLPFLTQDDYDRLLWLCDLNFVRGEDSFVRAQWAARPLVWQIYPQEDDAHRPKLDAFLDIYCLLLPEPALSAMRDFHLGWNRFGDLAWESFIAHRAAFERNAAVWAEHFSGEPDLASKLVIFCKNRV